MKFEMWSLGHFVFILAPFILWFILHLICKNKSYKFKQIIGIALSILAVILLVLRNIEIFVKNGYQLDAELIPLQICHFANFVLLLAFIKDNKVLFALSYCLNFPAALMSIIFANSLENYQTLLTFRGCAYIFGHILIVSLALFATTEGFVVLNKKVIKNTLLVVMILYISSLFINNFLNIFLNLNANYFYALKPENGTPLEWFYNWGTNINIGKFVFNPLYLLLTALLGAVVVLLFCAIYFGIKKVLNKKSSFAEEIKEIN